MDREMPLDREAWILDPGVSGEWRPSHDLVGARETTDEPVDCLEHLGSGRPAVQDREAPHAAKDAGSALEVKKASVRVGNELS